VVMQVSLITAVIATCPQLETFFLEELARR
jgi:hypothetical protein